MLRPRVIPCLLIHEGGLVKTVGFANPKYVGDPINAVKIFNEKESDELMVLDIDATANGAEPDYKTIAHLAAECRMPLAYGGGVRTAQQAKRIIRLGVEKVAVSAAALERPALVTEMADAIGRQSVVVVLDVKKKLLGGYEVYTHNGRRATGCSLVDAAREAQQNGAGEIVFNSIDRDGTMKGYDLKLASSLRESISIPMTVLGGAGRLDDIEQLVTQCGIVGAAAGSLFVFKGAYRAVLINYPQQVQKEELVQRALALHGAKA
jgi:imidazole glycerol-phosphate synthase subunit HisF